MKYVKFCILCLSFFCSLTDLSGSEIEQVLKPKKEVIMREMSNKEGFELWYDHMMRWEGDGINKNIEDVEGEGIFTNQGIKFDSWAMIAPKVLNIEDSDLRNRFNNMTSDEHKKIAFYYWQKSGAEKMNSGQVGAICCEAFWGGGYYALRNLQQEFNHYFDKRLVVDGIIGRKSANAFNDVDQEILFQRLCHAYLNRYMKLSKREDRKEFLRGWVNRLIFGYKNQKGFLCIFWG